MMGYARGRIVAQKPKRIRYLRWPASVMQGQTVVRFRTFTEPPMDMVVPAAGDVRLEIERRIKHWSEGGILKPADGPIDPAATLCAMEVGDAQD